MRMMLVGAGAVGESIVKVLKWRDSEKKWLEYVLICDFDKGRARDVLDMMEGDSRFACESVNATDEAGDSGASD